VIGLADPGLSAVGDDAVREILERSIPGAGMQDRDCWKATPAA